MEVNNRSNVNFKGTFVLNPRNAKVKEAVPNIIKQGRQIFYNVKNEGDIAIVTKDKYDKRIGEFIDLTKTKFEYYPEISTKDGLDDEIPSGFKKLLNLKKNCVIRDLNILKKFLSENSLHLKKQSEYIHNAVNTLRLNIENDLIEIDEHGIFFIRDEAKKRTIKSTGFKNGSAYLYVRPDSLSQEIKRYLINKNGGAIAKEFVTPKDITAFNKIFSKIKSQNKSV